MNWSNHVAVVTGAGSGIGKGIAQRFAEVGAEVVIAEINPAQGEAVARDLQERYGKGLFIQTNVASAAACQALIERTVATYGQIDTLVNNAGVNFVKPTLEMDEADWDRVIDVDLKGAFLCSRYALAEMVTRTQGSIVNIASVHTVATLPQAAPYAAAKGGVDMLTKALAIEFAPHGIRVNAVSPGPISTPLYGKLGLSEADTKAMAAGVQAQVPAGRFGSASEVAKTVIFLASDEASYIIGADLQIDGGMGTL